MQSLLELAFATRKYADVSYAEGSPNELTRVKVNVERVPAEQVARRVRRSRRTRSRVVKLTVWRPSRGRTGCGSSAPP